MNKYDRLLESLRRKDSRDPINADELFDAFEKKLASSESDDVSLRKSLGQPKSNSLKSKPYLWVIPSLGFLGLLFLVFILAPQRKELPVEITTTSIEKVKLKQVYTIKQPKSLQFEGKHQWDLSANTKIVIEEIKPGSAVVELAQGELKINRERKAPSQNLIKVKNIEITEIGTEYKVMHAQDEVTITVFHGIVEVKNNQSKEVKRLSGGEELLAPIREGRVLFPADPLMSETSNAGKNDPPTPKWLDDYSTAQIKAQLKEQKAWINQSKLLIVKDNRSPNEYTLPSSGSIESIHLGEAAVFLLMQGEYHYFLNDNAWMSKRIGATDSRQIYILKHKIAMINQEGKYFLYSDSGELLDETHLGPLLWRGVVYKNDLLIIPSISNELILIDNAKDSIAIEPLEIPQSASDDLHIEETDLIVPVTGKPLKLKLEKILGSLDR